MKAIVDPIVIAKIVDLLMPDDDYRSPDLSYDPKRIGKRVAGASSTTKFIYEALVAAGDQGRTVDELVDQLAELIGTNEYRAYERRLRMQSAQRASREVRQRGGDEKEARETGRAAFVRSPAGATDADGNFTPEFMRRGRRWAIRRALGEMTRVKAPGGTPTARRVGDRWFAGERAPNVLLNWQVRPETERTIVAPHDPARTEAFNARMAAIRGAQERAQKALGPHKSGAKKDASIRELLALLKP
jgi:hypothetical protein